MPVPTPFACFSNYFLIKSIAKTNIIMLFMFVFAIDFIKIYLIMFVFAIDFIKIYLKGF